jgi:nucleoside-diphosphate-sugar epimerase
MKLLVTGGTGFLGWRSSTLLAERGHDVIPLTRPGGADRAHSAGLETVEIDAGDPAARELIAGCDAVLHFAGVPDPAQARADPTRAVRENVGTVVNLLAGCLEHNAGLIYPSTVRAGVKPPPDVYALSKWLGEQACQRHPAPATVVVLTSIFGPGQVAWEGATGAIAAFAARALEGAPIVIPGDPRRTRDFIYVDDVVSNLERIVREHRWDERLTVASGVATPLLRVAELVREVAATSSEIQTPGGALPAGEDQSYAADPEAPGIGCPIRPLEEGIASYVDWLRRHPAAQSRARA